MKPFDSLTKRGKVQRLRQIAINALAAYDLDVAKISFLTTHTNTMFVVRTADKTRYVLRIYSDEETTLVENRAEIYWLTRIIRDTDLHVTRPVARRDGEYISVVEAPGVPGPRRCVLFEWVPGGTLDKHLSPQNHETLGRAMATLHNHAEALRPLPDDINPKQWDRVFYYFDEPVVYNTPEYSHLFTSELVRLIDLVIERATLLLEELHSDPTDEILIHGDLHYWNAHVYRGQVHLIDFEDVMLGYPVQDVAVTLICGRFDEGYTELRAAYERGYRSVRPWPVESERQLQTLYAARTTNFVNYGARIMDDPQDYVESRCAQLQAFLERYG